MIVPISIFFTNITLPHFLLEVSILGSIWSYVYHVLNYYFFYLRPTYCFHCWCLFPLNKGSSHRTRYFIICHIAITDKLLRNERKSLQLKNSKWRVQFLARARKLYQNKRKMLPQKNDAQNYTERQITSEKAYNFVLYRRSCSIQYGACGYFVLTNE